MLASAEVPSQRPPVLQVADAVLDADPLGRVGLAFGLVGGGEGWWDRQLVLPPGRPRSDHRAGGWRAQALVAGVGEQGDAWGEGQQLDQAGLADLVRSWMESGRLCPQNSSRPSASVMISALIVLARALPETKRFRSA